MAKNANKGRLNIYPFSGGLETISIPGMQTVGRLVSGSNFMVDINGAKKKMSGCVQQDDDATIVVPGFNTGFTQGLFDYWRTSGSTKVQRTVLISDGSIYADNANGIYVDVTGAFSILPTDNVSIETFYGLMVMGFENNPASTPLKFNGTAVSALGGTPPNARHFRTFRNRMFATGVPTVPDRIYYSAIDNPEDWTGGGGGGSVSIDQGDQDPTGFTSLFPPMFGRMIAGKRRSLFELTYVSGTLGVANLIDGIGSLEHNAVASGDNDIYFVSERGIHSLMMTDKYGQLETSFLSYPIQNWFQENVDFRRSKNMRMIYAPEINAILLSLTQRGSSRNDTVLGYNFALKEWYKWDENVSSFAKYVDHADGYKTKILVANDDGKVGILDFNKSGRAVTWFDEQKTTQFSTGIIYPINVVTEITLSKITAFFKPQTTGSSFTISYLVNGKFIEDLTFDMSPETGQPLIGSAIIGVDKIGGQGIVKQVTRQMHGEGHAVELVFTHTPTTDEEDFELYGLVLEYDYSGETEKPKVQ